LAFAEPAQDPRPQGGPQPVKLSRSASYAVEALAYLAARGDGGLVPSHDIARACGTPEGYLRKLFGLLVRAVLAYGVKGPNGGYRLARPAAGISLLEVVEAADGALFGDVDAVGTDQALNQRLQAVFDRATDAERCLVAGLSVADLAGGKRKTRGRDRS
jgi:Rrf2 family transcriptional regulator, iron-sulfur cluster assembly transcription factor